MHHLHPSRFNILYKLAVCITLFSSVSVDTSAQTTPITSSGLNTQVSAPIVVGTQTQYNITGGTRPGGTSGTNLFHSFGNFNVPTNNIANFLNETALPTNNILARVTGGNLSSIYGTIQTTGFGNANLFLMNPAGFLFGPNAIINVGGMVAFTSADYLRLSDGVRFNTVPDAAADALLTTAPVIAYGFLGSNPGAITVQGSQFTVTEGTGISLVGGNITIQSGTLDNGTVQPAKLSAPGGQINLGSIGSPGELLALDVFPAPNVMGQMPQTAGRIHLEQNSTVDVTGSGRVSIRGGQFVIDVGKAVLSTAPTASTAGPDNVVLGQNSVISTQTFGDEPGSEIQIAATNVRMDGARIESSATGFGPGGPININASSIDINNAQILSSVIPPDFVADRTDGPPITLNVHNLNIRGGGVIAADSVDIFAALQPIVSGTITINATGTITVSGSIPFGPQSRIESHTDGGAVGNIVINTKNLLVTDGARINSDASFGLAGQILINASDSVTVSDGGKIRMDTSFGGGGLGLIDIGAHNIEINQAIIQTLTASEGDAGAVHLHGDNITLAGGQINTMTEVGLGRGGDVTLDATNKVSITGQFAGNAIDNPGPAGVFTTTSFSFSNGAAGNISVTAPNVELSGGAKISSDTFGAGNAGNILVKGNSVSVTGGAQITSSSAIGELGEIPSGNAGTVTIQGLASPAQFIVIDGAGSGIFTETQGTGAGGNIVVNANSVTMTNGAAISADSAGTANAGNIDITATNGLTMQNSKITTLVPPSSTGTNAGGGDIKITTSPEATVYLQNSTISASVANGSGPGGDISIDPQFVILQNSKILAQAADGQGGAITITTGLFLPDAYSAVNADSGSGLNGTVTIQSPISPASGRIIPLSQKPLIATSLLNQRCAALAGGEFSSFTLAGRDTLPTEPGGWLPSPLAALTAGTGQEARGEGDTAVLSLRRIAPAGFLTQTFAADESTGCTS